MICTPFLHSVIGQLLDAYAGKNGTLLLTGINEHSQDKAIRVVLWPVEALHLKNLTSFREAIEAEKWERVYFKETETEYGDLIHR